MGKYYLVLGSRSIAVLHPDVTAREAAVLGIQSRCSQVSAVSISENWNRGGAEQVRCKVSFKNIQFSSSGQKQLLWLQSPQSGEIVTVTDSGCRTANLGSTNCSQPSVLHLLPCNLIAAA